VLVCVCSSSVAVVDVRGEGDVGRFDDNVCLMCTGGVVWVSRLTLTGLNEGVKCAVAHPIASGCVTICGVCAFVDNSNRCFTLTVGLSSGSLRQWAITYDESRTVQSASYPTGTIHTYIILILRMFLFT
jgi:hypothetical protein